MIEQIRERRRAGWTLQDIQREAGVAYYTVLQYCKGIHPSNRPERQPLAVAEVIEDTRDFTARFCGDPLPGRSALDRMKEAS